MMKFVVLNCIFFWALTALVAQSQTVLKGSHGDVSFVSEAPLEVIKASSAELQGVLVPESGKFAFQVEVNSFEGFNNPLQRIHFQENYLESSVYPKAYFEGKIVERLDFKIPGRHSVRAKGSLTIHGESRERIIRGDIEFRENEAIIVAEFSILLEDHAIHVPRIVNQKIAEEINILLRIELK